MLSLQREGKPGIGDGTHADSNPNTAIYQLCDVGRPRALAWFLYLSSGNTDTSLRGGALELSP